MGRRTTTSYDDELSAKMRSVVTEVLDRLHRHGELGHVRSLYPPSAQARIDAEPPGPSGSLRESEKFPYTFEHFVEHLDPTDGTFYNLMELLITLTARKAIASAAERSEVARTMEGAANYTNSLPFPSTSANNLSTMTHAPEATLPATAEASTAPHRLLQLRSAAQQAVRTSRECQREMVLCRAVQGEIRVITRRNRRSRSSDDSDSSSESLQFASPPLTRTVFSTLVDPTSESHERANAAATTRAARVGQRDNGAGSSEQGYHWIQRDLSSIRRRLDQTRDAITGRSNPARGARSYHWAALTPLTNPVNATSNIRTAGDVAAGQQFSSLASDVGDSSGNTFVRRFLSQPFPSDVRRSSASAATAARGDDGTRVGLNSTLASQDPSPPSPVLFTNTSAALDPVDVHITEDTDVAAQSAADVPDPGAQARLEAVQAALNRLTSAASRAATEEPADMTDDYSRRHSDRTGEFEAFSAHRRLNRRASRMDLSRDDSDVVHSGLNAFSTERDVDDDDADRAMMESAVFQLIRADDTIRRIADEHAVNDGRGIENDGDADGGGASSRMRDPLARRLGLPLNDGRPIAHLPPRSRTRSVHRDESATL